MTNSEIIEQLDSIVGTYEILVGNGVNSDILGIDDIEALREAIEVLKAEPCMGRWEWVQYDGNPNIGNWHCSECNRIVCGAITAVNPVYSYKYCPNCGAKMEEVE